MLEMRDIVDYRGRGRKVKTLVEDFKASTPRGMSEKANICDSEKVFEEFELSTDEKRELKIRFADISSQPDSRRLEEPLDIEKISQLVNGTVSNLKGELESLDLSEENLTALLELEKRTKNRKTAKRAVNKELEKISSKKPSGDVENDGNKFEQTVLAQDRDFSSKLDRLASRSDRIDKAKLKKSIRLNDETISRTSSHENGKAGLIRELELDIPLEALKDFKAEDLQEIVKEQKRRKKLIKYLEAAGLDPECLEEASTSDLKTLKSNLD